MTRLTQDDRGLATVVGAIIVIAIMGTAVLYVNAYYVPRQGHTLEVDTREQAQQAMLSLSDRMSGDPVPFVHELPLKARRAVPPLLDGVVLSPIRADGELLFQPGAALATISHVTTAPAGGVPSGDATRVDLGGGKMRVYLVGSSAGPRALGSVQLSVGGAYLEEASVSLEGGAVIARRDSGSSMVAPPALHVTSIGTPSAPVTGVTWRVPLLVGALGEVGGRESAQISLAPGPLARAGAVEPVYETRVEVQTDALAAWTEALEAAVGSYGTVTSTSTGPDSGTVTAVIGDPAGTTPSVMVDYSAVRYSVQLTTRAGS